MKLTVSVRIAPHPEHISSEALNELFSGELAEFEEYFMRVQRDRSAVSPGPLLTGEKSIIRAYMHYAYTTTQKRDEAHTETEVKA
jgi:hypothetical protein